MPSCLFKYAAMENQMVPEAIIIKEALSQKVLFGKFKIEKRQKKQS